jgi:transcriptional regulator with XRE-family HTH domain
MIRIEMNTQVIRSLVRGRQPEIAKALGIAVTSFSRKINGKQRVYLDEVNRLAEILGVDVPIIVRFFVDGKDTGDKSKDGEKAAKKSQRNHQPPRHTEPGRLAYE